MRRRFRSGTSPWETPPGRRGTTGAVGGDVTQVVPYILPSTPEPPTRKTERTVARDGRAGHPRLEAGELRTDTLRLRARGGEDVGIGPVTACPRLLHRRRNLLAPVVFFANCRLISWGGASLFSTRLRHKGPCRSCTFLMYPACQQDVSAPASR